MVIDFVRERLRSDTALVWASQMLNALLSVVLGKMIAVNFAADEFGQYSLVISSLFLYSSLFFNPILQFFVFKLGDNSEQHLLDSFIWGVLAFNLVFFLFPFIISLSIPGVTYWDRFLLFILAIGQSWISLFLNEANISKRYWINSLALILPQIINLILIVVAGFMNWGGSAVLLLAIATANICTALFFLVRKYVINAESIRIKSSLHHFKFYLFGAVKFSTPLVLLALINWLVSYGDRYLIAYFMSANDVGLYSANYGLASKVLLLLTGPSLTLLRPAVYDIKTTVPEKKKYVLNSIFRHSIVGIFFVLVFVFFSNKIGLILLSTDYQAGFGLMLPIAFAFLVFTCTLYFDLFFYALSKTYNILMIYGVGMIFNLGLNIWFIPEWGLQGACYANIISYAIQFILAAILFWQID